MFICLYAVCICAYGYVTLISNYDWRAVRMKRVNNGFIYFVSAEPIANSKIVCHKIKTACAIDSEIKYRYQVYQIYMYW
ncbi:hypothetical protein F4703DRAFT_1858425 [Phycomyces blakesleeanus]